MHGVLPILRNGGGDFQPRRRDREIEIAPAQSADLLAAQSRVEDGLINCRAMSRRYAQQPDDFIDGKRPPKIAWGVVGNFPHMLQRIGGDQPPAFHPIGKRAHVAQQVVDRLRTESALLAPRGGMDHSANVALVQVSRERRDVAFPGIVLDNYNHTCAVTGQRFISANHTEADGAHIIGKSVRGTDDPRNDIALSKSAHWAFDRGIFTNSDQYEVVINPKARSANVANFPLVDYDLEGSTSRVTLTTGLIRMPSPGINRKFLTASSCDVQ